jgi:Putative beta-barrel porin-2, OmpL-like. bbp2
MLTALSLGLTLVLGQTGAEPAPEPAPVPVEVLIQVLAPPPPAPMAAAPPPATPDRWFFMREAQGTWPGYLLDGHRLSLSGWVEGSFTASTVGTSNQPVVWNDRANRFLLNQFWTRFERPVVTNGTTESTWGFRLDVLAGTDYRFTLPRGLWNSQLENARGTQNLYGVDPVQFYLNWYEPTWFQGTEFRVGRMYCQFGYESNEGISTPFVSRTYTFNWSPFTHTGLMVLAALSPQWTVNLMLINGNDVFLDPAEELRFAGKVTWTSAAKRDTVALGTSVGRGQFNAGEPFNPATVSTPAEPAGRNNVNVLDLVWTHTFTSRFSYSLELLAGYQTNVPAGVPGGLVGASAGTAHWYAAVHYLSYTLTDTLTALARFEAYDDVEGQRTGFEGVYTALTVGVQCKPTKELMIRPEVRYDYNGSSTPFEGRHGLLTGALDFIVRW